MPPRDVFEGHNLSMYYTYAISIGVQLTFILFDICLDC